MKITLSRSQWEAAGKKAGWLKTAALNVSYTGIVPNESISGTKVVPSQTILSNFKIPEGWIPHANHMTINLGAAKTQDLVGKEVSFSLVAIGQDDKVMAAQVQSEIGSMNNPPHITIAVNPNGGKPMMAASLKEWKPITPIQLKGKILEVLQDGTILSADAKQKDLAAQNQNTQAKQQTEQAKKANSPTSVIKENKWNREQSIEYLKSKNLPQQAWENILKAAGI